MEELLSSLIVFIVVYLAYVVFVISRKEKLNKLKKGTITKYIINRYKIDIKTINFKVFAHMIALSTAFIISITFFIISFIDNVLLKIVLCFTILLPFQYLMYMLIGKLYKNHK